MGTALRSGAPAGRTSWGSPWALTLDDLAGRIKCYAVVRGSCWLTMAGSEPVLVEEGACFVLPTGRTVVIGSERLLHSDDAVARIAGSLGYESEHAFNTAFKRVMGMPPRRYARSAGPGRVRHPGGG